MLSYNAPSHTYSLGHILIGKPDFVYQPRPESRYSIIQTSKMIRKTIQNRLDRKKTSFHWKMAFADIKSYYNARLRSPKCLNWPPQVLPEIGQLSRHILMFMR